MDEKEIILRQIAESFVTQISHSNLIFDLQDNYGIPTRESEQLLRQYLLDGYITAHNQRYSITQKGKRYLNSEDKPLYDVAERSNEAHNPIKKVQIDWTKWGTITAIITLIVTVILSKC